MKPAAPSDAPRSTQELWTDLNKIDITSEAADRAQAKVEELDLGVPEELRKKLRSSATGALHTVPSQAADYVHPSQVDRKEMTQAVSKLHNDVADALIASQKEIGELEKARTELLQNEPERKTKLAEIDQQLWAVRDARQELGAMGRILTAMRGEKLHDKAGANLQLTEGMPLPLASFAGLFVIGGFKGRNDETGRRTTFKDVGAIVANPFAVGLGTLGNRKVGGALQVSGVYAGTNPVLGEVAGISLPWLASLGFGIVAGLYSRPNGSSGFELGINLPAPIPSVKIGLEHQLLKPIVLPVIKPFQFVVGGVMEGVKALGRGMQRVGDMIGKTDKADERAQETDGSFTQGAIKEAARGRKTLGKWVRKAGEFIAGRKEPVDPSKPVEAESSQFRPVADRTYVVEGREYTFTQGFLDALGPSAEIDFETMSAVTPWAIHPESGDPIAGHSAVLYKNEWIKPETRTPLADPGAGNAPVTFNAERRGLLDRMLGRDKARAPTFTMQTGETSKEGTFSWENPKAERPSSEGSTAAA